MRTTEYQAHQNSLSRSWKHFRNLLFTYRYELLLISELIGILVPSMIRQEGWRLAEAFTSSLVLIATLNLFTDKKRFFKLILGIVGINIMLHWLSTATGNERNVILFRNLLGIIYYLGVSTELFRQIYKKRVVDSHTIIGVVAGYILIILAGALVFTLIELFLPGSFSNIADDPVRRREDLIYYSFISILTIGYGDIAPLRVFARSTTVILALMGHFYMTIVMAVMIGKFMNQVSVKQMKGLKTRTLGITVKGKVQGVWFRQNTLEKAYELGIVGTVRNMPNGDVYIEATGSNATLKHFLSWCHDGPRNAVVKEVHTQKLEATEFNGFEIIR